MQSGSASLTHASLSTELGDVDEADLEAGETLQQLSSAVTRYEAGAGKSPAAGGLVRGMQKADRAFGGIVITSACMAVEVKMLLEQLSNATMRWNCIEATCLGHAVSAGQALCAYKKLSTQQSLLLHRDTAASQLWLRHAKCCSTSRGADGCYSAHGCDAHVSHADAVMRSMPGAAADCFW